MRFALSLLVCLLLADAGFAAPNGISVTGAGGGRARTGGGSYSAEAQQFFDRITDPGATRKNLYASMIDSVVSCGVWSKLDAWWMFAANSSSVALTNIKNSSFTASTVGSPTFTTDSGYSDTSGSGSNYLNSNYNIPTSTTNFTQNSAHLSVWFGNSGSGPYNNPAVGIQYPAGGVTNQIEPYVSGTGTTCRINESSESSAYSNSTFYTMLTANRSSSTAEQCYAGSSSLGSITNTSGTATSANLYIMKANSSTFGTAGIVRAVTVGGSLSSSDVTCLYDAQHTYLQTVAGVP